MIREMCTDDPRMNWPEKKILWKNNYLSASYKAVIVTNIQHHRRLDRPDWCPQVNAGIFHNRIFYRPDALHGAQ